MAIMANHQGLALARRHPLDPGGDLPTSFSLQISQVPNMVNLHIFLRAAEFTGISEEPLQQLGPIVPDQTRAIIEDCLGTVLQRNAAPLGYQRALALSRDLNLEDLARPFRCVRGHGKAIPDLLNSGPSFDGQRLGEGLLHDPSHTVETMKVQSESIILNETPILRLEPFHDAEFGIAGSFLTVNRFIATHVARAFCCNHTHGHFECDLPIDAATTQLSVFGIMLQDADLVAKEIRGFSPRMGNQGLCVG